ncbi:MAG: hypothetical protein ABSA52_01685 [Candidatus Binatia bacterium]
MRIEEAVLTRLRTLGDSERERLLRQIDEWIAQNAAAQSADVNGAMAAVRTTWASVALDRATLRWIAEDTELEYEHGG